MTDYQTLLDQAIDLVQAERGFVVLYDALSGSPIELVGRHNYDAAFLIQPWQEMVRTDPLIRRALPRIAQERKPLLTHTYDERFFPPDQGDIVADRRFLSIIVEPLPHVSGFLWCDSLFRTNVFKPEDQLHLALLVRYGEVP